MDISVEKQYISGQISNVQKAMQIYLGYCPGQQQLFGHIVEGHHITEIFTGK